MLLLRDDPMDASRWKSVLYHASIINAQLCLTAGDYSSSGSRTKQMSIRQVVEGTSTSSHSHLMPLATLIYSPFGLMYVTTIFILVLMSMLSKSISLPLDHENYVSSEQVRRLIEPYPVLLNTVFPTTPTPTPTDPTGRPQEMKGENIEKVTTSRGDVELVSLLQRHSTFDFDQALQRCYGGGDGEGEGEIKGLQKLTFNSPSLSTHGSVAECDMPYFLSNSQPFNAFHWLLKEKYVFC